VDNTGLATIALMVFSAKAAYQVAAYRRWQAGWKALAPDGDAPCWRPKPAALVAIISVIVMGLAMAWTSDADPSVSRLMMPIAILCALLGLTLALLRALYRIWARLRNGRLGKQSVMALAITRPILRPLSIRACYRRLPRHCHILLKAGNA